VISSASAADPTMPCRARARRRSSSFALAFVLALLGGALPLSAQQDVDPLDGSSTRRRLALDLQPGVVFARLTGDAADAADLGWRNRQALQVRITYPVVSVVTAFVEGGASTRGARTRGDAGGARPIEEIHLT
jgi:hypothetical protein